MRNVGRTSTWRLFVLFGALSATPLIGQQLPGFALPTDWPVFGQNAANTASSKDTTISATNVQSLKPKWTFTTGGDVSARAAIVNGVAYFPDWGGYIWAVNVQNGKSIWSHQLSDYGLTAGTVSRTSPTVANGIVYIGTQYTPTGKTGWLLAINAATGSLLWKVQPDTSNPFPVITGSPVVSSGIVYVGMTSNEEYAASSPTYACCSARGSVVAVDASFGFKLWQTFTVPVGYSGGNSWGSNPVVDLLRGLVVVGTGNNYSVPTDPAFLTCIAKPGATQASCLSPDDHADSIVAFDMFTGQIRWATRLMTWGQEQTEGVADGTDFWNTSCAAFIPGSSTKNCPNINTMAPDKIPAGPDYDFGSDPNEITYQTASGPKTIIGAGQKSGIYYALNPDTGAELWHTQVGPGSSLGGMEWGQASDGKRIYVSIANFYGIPYGFKGSINAGSWSALDPATGTILWQAADPNGAIDLGPLTVSNGVLFVPSMGAGSPLAASGSTTAPTMLALDASTGKTLWQFSSGSSVIAGASIVDGVVYWGSGYGHLGLPGFSANKKFYAFSLSLK
jgi:polyvinyl alcohol dehydrogenase (cytochrome)